MNRTEELCSKLADRVSGEFRLSKRGVPHVVVTRGSIVHGDYQVYSACYFLTSRTWTIFFPYGRRGEHEQTKLRGKTYEEVAAFFDEKGGPNGDNLPTV